MPSKRISLIEALRGLAAISVALFHFCNQLSSEAAAFVAKYGFLGVDVFFVISGFVIPLSLYGKGYSARDFPAFMLRRMVRLEPPYLASIALTIVLLYAGSMTPWFRGGPPNLTFEQVGLHLFYLIPLSNYDWISPVYWSLAYEFVFYIVVGLTFATLIKRPVEFTVLMGASAFAIYYMLWAEANRAIIEFMLGALVMRWIICDGRKAALLWWLGVSLLGIFLAGGAPRAIAAGIAAFAIMFLRHIECGRWALFIGGLSYSLYLVHVPIGGRVINIGKRFIHGPIYELFLVTAALALSMAVAFLLAKTIERWAIRASRKVPMSRNPSPTASVVPSPP
jgi:peptidoglycan/LPS O-acetylase OafA/YrhL